MANIFNYSIISLTFIFILLLFNYQSVETILTKKEKYSPKDLSNNIHFQSNSFSKKGMSIYTEINPNKQIHILSDNTIEMTVQKSGEGDIQLLGNSFSFSSEISNLTVYIDNIKNFTVEKCDNTQINNKNSIKLDSEVHNIKIEFDGYLNTARYMFQYCDDIISMNLSRLNTFKITAMDFMFISSKKIKTLDLHNFNTSGVSNMEYMFAFCESLISLDLTSFDTKNVKKMMSLFNSCNKLISLDLSSFDTSSVYTMEDMFYSCSSLIHLNLSSFNTKSVNDMRQMFYGCSSLLSLDLSNFDTTDTQLMVNIFYNCSSMLVLDISNLDLTRIVSLVNIFAYCSSLISLNMKNLKIDNSALLIAEIKSLPNLCSINIKNSVLENDDSFYSQIANTIEFKDITIFQSDENADTTKYPFLKTNEIIFYRNNNMCQSKCADGLFATSFSACLMQCPIDYLNDTYTEISQVFKDNGKEIMGISIHNTNLLINNISQCHTFFISCKIGEFTGTPLDNKCSIINNITQCEDNYKVDPFKDTNCIPTNQYWYMTSNNYVYGLSKCPSDKSYLITEIGQCVESCSNHSLFSYTGEFLHYNGDDIPHCVTECPTLNYYSNTTHCLLCNEACIKCSNGGTEDNTNCLANECNNDRGYYAVSDNPTKCITESYILQNNVSLWYFEDNKYTINLKKCPDSKPYLIKDTGQCVESCFNSTEYSSENGYLLYETDDIKYCVKQCPEEHYFSNSTHCLKCHKSCIKCNSLGTDNDTQCLVNTCNLELGYYPKNINDSILTTKTSHCIFFNCTVEQEICVKCYKNFDNTEMCDKCKTNGQSIKDYCNFGQCKSISECSKCVENNETYCETCFNGFILDENENKCRPQNEVVIEPALNMDNAFVNGNLSHFTFELGYISEDLRRSIKSNITFNIKLISPKEEYISKPICTITHSSVNIKCEFDILNSSFVNEKYLEIPEQSITGSIKKLRLLDNNENDMNYTVYVKYIKSQYPILIISCQIYEYLTAEGKCKEYCPTSQGIFSKYNSVQNCLNSVPENYYVNYKERFYYPCPELCYACKYNYNMVNKLSNQECDICDQISSNYPITRNKTYSRCTKVDPFINQIDENSVIIENINLYLYTNKTVISGTQIDFEEIISELNISDVNILEIHIKDRDSLISSTNYILLDKNFKEIDLSKLDNKEVPIAKKLDENEKEKIQQELEFQSIGINVTDINDPFFQDRCKPYKSNGVDYSMKIRINDIYQGQSVCGDGCTIDENRTDSQSVKETGIAYCKCSLEAILSVPKVKNIRNEKDIIMDQFSKLNFGIVKCSHLFFDWDNLHDNIAYHIIAFEVRLYIVVVIIFLCYDKKNLYEIWEERMYKTNIPEDGSTPDILQNLPENPPKKGINGNDDNNENNDNNNVKNSTLSDKLVLTGKSKQFNPDDNKDDLHASSMINSSSIDNQVNEIIENDQNDNDFGNDYNMNTNTNLCQDNNKIQNENKIPNLNNNTQNNPQINNNQENLSKDKDMSNDYYLLGSNSNLKGDNSERSNELVPLRTKNNKKNNKMDDIQEVDEKTMTNPNNNNITNIQGKNNENLVQAEVQDSQENLNNHPKHENYSPLKKLDPNLTPSEYKSQFLQDFQKNCKVLPYLKYTVYTRKREMHYSFDVLMASGVKANFFDSWFELSQLLEVLVRVFFKSDTFESNTLNILLLMYNTTGTFFLAALYYFDTVVEERYENNGTLTVLTTITTSIFASLTSLLFTFVGNKLYNYTGKYMVAIQQAETRSTLKRHHKRFIRRAEITITCFIIFGFLFMLFFLYYLSIFCVVYNGSSTSWFVQGLISLALGIGTNLIVAFGMSIFRVAGGYFKMRFVYNFYLHTVKYFLGAF